ncbi:KipI family sensor histidine kinase inhibitor [Mesorhizobium soli]|uniref:5-oxoprolinase subunit PxpB n=1 Tax=Pseudaminobacter soli (ex Li et al. 2025) TaxID=1295366 RepID=UPI00247689B2|nr:5-oxoprolinase subunit PxpB [Mesorhizobium soli]MDH6234591.1 KipI family sensor histidine kinase inhibitor [Mesorhizobium soli]
MIPTFLPCGDSALVIELGDRIDADVNARVISLAAAVEAAAIPGVVEIVPSYRSVLVRYDPEIIRGRELEERLADLSEHLEVSGAQARSWNIPVVYGGEVGQDLEEIAAMKGLSPEELIALHAGGEYRVFMIGFAPGFAYLGGLPAILHTPRLQKPRQSVPAGAIGIGGQQGSVNSVAGPSGWRFIGWTPIRVFDPARKIPFLLQAGDRVSFVPIDPETGERLAARAAAGETVIEPEEAA